MKKILPIFLGLAMVVVAGCEYAPKRCTGSPVKACKPYILFDYNSYVINADEVEYLSWACQKAKVQDWRNIIIDAHTYLYGDEGNTYDMGQMRANAVRNYLISCGVDAERIHVHILGNTQLKTENPDDQYNNRRVVIRYSVNYGDTM